MKLITPEQLASTGKESGEQKALFCWIADNPTLYPELKWLFHIPNGGLRGKAAAANIRAMGVKPGVPDLCLPIKRGPWSGLYIELKRLAHKTKKGGGTSNEQDEWIPFLQSQGYGAIVCYGWIEARDILITYLEWKG